MTLLTVSRPKAARRPVASARPVILGSLGIVGFLFVWQLAGMRGQFGAAIPPFTDIVVAWGWLAVDSRYWLAIGQTLSTWLIGFVLTALLAILSGIALSGSVVAQRALRPTIEFLRPIPPVTVLPLALLLYGSSLSMQLLLIVFGCFLPMLTQTLYGLREIDPVARSTFSTFGIGGARRVVWLSIPSASPFVATGLRVAASLALLITITTELLGSAPGLGLLLLTSQANGEYSQMLAVIATIGLIGLIISLTFSRVERRLLHWNGADR